MHKMMQQYMRAYNLKYSRKRPGRVIRQQFSEAFLRQVSRNFYDDMVKVFSADFGC